MDTVPDMGGLWTYPDDWADSADQILEIAGALDGKHDKAYARMQDAAASWVGESVRALNALTVQWQQDTAAQRAMFRLRADMFRAVGRSLQEVDHGAGVLIAAAGRS